MPHDVTESVALTKFHCPACGAEAQWNPAKQALVCPFCGTESPAQVDATGEIVEHDLVAALRDRPSGYCGEDRREVKCQSCQAISVFDPPARRSAASSAARPRSFPTPNRRLRRPESLLPFRVTRRRRATHPHVVRPPVVRAVRVEAPALTDTVNGVYLPYWTFDAHVDADWTAEAGYYYYTTETYESNGQTQTRQVQHVRWEPAAGPCSISSTTNWSALR